MSQERTRAQLVSAYVDDLIARRHAERPDADGHDTADVSRVLDLARALSDIEFDTPPDLKRDVWPLPSASEPAAARRRSVWLRRVWPRFVRQRFVWQRPLWPRSVWRRPLAVAGAAVRSIVGWPRRHRLAAAMAVAAMVIALLVRPAPPVSAAELLQASAQAETARLERPGFVSRRAYTVEARRMPGARRLATRRVEVWINAAERVKARRVFDEAHRLLAGEWTYADGSRIVYTPGRPPQPGRTTDAVPVTVDSIWRWDPSAADFSRLAGTHVDRIAAALIGGGYRLSFDANDAGASPAGASSDAASSDTVSSDAASSDTASSSAGASGSASSGRAPSDVHASSGNAFRGHAFGNVRGGDVRSGIARVELTLDADRTALAQRIVLRDGDETIEVRSTRQEAEELPLSTVARASFEPDSALLPAVAGLPDGTAAAADGATTIAPPTPPRLSALAITGVELEATYRLHHLSGCLARPGELRTHAGRVHIAIVAATEACRTDVSRALASLEQTPGVTVEIAVAPPRVVDTPANAQPADGAVEPSRPPSPPSPSNDATAAAAAMADGASSSAAAAAPLLTAASPADDDVAAIPLHRTLYEMYARTTLRESGLPRDSRQADAAINLQVRRLVVWTRHRSRRVLAYARELERLASRWPPQTLAPLGLDQASRWQALVRDNARALSEDTALLLVQLRPVFDAASTGAPSSATADRATGGGEQGRGQTGASGSDRAAGDRAADSPAAEDRAAADDLAIAPLRNLTDARRAIGELHALVLAEDAAIARLFTARAIASAATAALHGRTAAGNPAGIGSAPVSSGAVASGELPRLARELQRVVRLADRLTEPWVLEP